MADIQKQKVIVLGSTSVGKSTLIQRYITGKFQSDLAFTIGLSYLEVLSERTRPLSVSYTLWDTGGAERYRSIFRSHFRGTDVALLVFDVTSKESYEEACSVWKTELWVSAPEARVILVGTKVDRDQDRVISSETARSFASRNGYSFFETSALTGRNVDALFWGIANILARVRKYTDIESSGFSSSIRICQCPREGSQEKKQKNCCNTS